MDFREKVNPTVQSIADLFRDNRYRIPSYQRGYSWGIDQITDLWDDLIEVANGERDSHFFGQLVTFFAHDNRQEIIDGQQRVTTSQILLAVIKNISNETKNEAKRGLNSDNDDTSDGFAESRQIFQQSDNALDNGDRLITSKSSDEDDVQAALVNLIKNGRQLDDKKTDNEAINNMWKAYDYFARQLNAEIKTLRINDRVNRLKKIFDAFFNRFYIVKVIAPNRQDAFTIFETLNSRGADLTASDIIKSHILSLFSTNPEKTDFASHKWNQIARTLGSQSKLINKFIRSYWMAKNGHITENKLYRVISKNLNTEPEATAFLNESTNLVSLYAALIDNHEYFLDERINRILDILSKTHFTLYYPIVLALEHAKLSNDTVLRVLNKVLSVFTRYRLICDKTTNTLENAFSNVAIKIWHGDLQSAEDIVAELNQYNVSDAEVASAFSTLQKDGGLKGPKRWVLNYLLASIYFESFNLFENADEMYRTVFTNGIYSPLRINDEIEYPELRNAIGNWTIIEKNLIPGKKAATNLNAIVKVLAKSKLSINGQIADHIIDNKKRWKQTDILERQRQLGTDVPIIWH
ncbi:DUF262 domain-containing protein [Nicoliella spurrieriana]|uniref:DUF262 domain-containing protein n=1 Tax=Nicoliella spurrieriana TaxID=2925830 RepID=A0A976X676_9LACO|nr:DUF262 domain-containing protein [Nicoliella spurrieriana]UQS87286.1 DUF262 domain-containing protein [Nicoliella spurrieriana]